MQASTPTPHFGTSCRFIWYTSYFFLSVLLTSCAAITPTPTTTSPTNTSSNNGAAATAISSVTRPLQLPTLTAGQACPREQTRSITERFGKALGVGPVYAAGFEPNGELPFSVGNFEGSKWDGNKVLWFVDPRYTGPVLIRGQRIDAPGELRFDQGQTPANDIRIDALPSNESPYWRDRPSFTRFQSAGCYAYQIDGLDFSYTITFEAKSAAQ